MSNFKEGDEVELALGFDHLYNPDILRGRLKGAFVGCRGIVRDIRDDGEGFPHIFVEWSKEDWRYAGMPDGWTFESHFRKVVPPITRPRDNSDLIVQDIVNRAERRDEQEREPCKDCGKVHVDVDRNADFIESLIGVEQDILDSDAYAVITMHRDVKGETDDVVVYEGRIIHAELSDAATEALERQIIDLAARIILGRRL